MSVYPPGLWLAHAGSRNLGSSSQALMGTEQKERRPTYSEVFVGGAIAGVVQCSVHTPAEVRMAIGSNRCSAVSWYVTTC
jgi:hypothetical protein